ncbi:MAG: ABC transporter permease [Lachnospiraceae bacterium]|nr:ABC transporter permease [Lachnospiraceae bacterium]
MRSLYVFFWLQLKRAFKVFPVVLITALIFTGCILLLLCFGYRNNDKPKEDEPVIIGIVGETDDKYLAAGLSAVRYFDSSRFALKLVEMSEEEAKIQTGNGEISGYAIIPEGFAASIKTGENKPVILVTSKAVDNIVSLLVRDFADSISKYLNETQSSIYGVEAYLKSLGGYEDVWKEINDINKYYVNLVLHRDELYEPVVIVKNKAKLSANAGFMCGFMIFMIAMFGIAYTSIYVRRSVALNSVLASGGLSIIFQVMAEYIAYLCAMFFCLMPMIVMIVLGVYGSGISIYEWERWFLEDYSYFIRGFIPLIIMFSAAQYLLFLVADNYIFGIFLQFVFAVFFSYMGGCLYPISFFPEVVRRIAGYQPCGLAYGYLADIILLNNGSGRFVGMLLYSLVFIVASVCVMSRRIRNEN